MKKDMKRRAGITGAGLLTESHDTQRREKSAAIDQRAAEKNAKDHREKGGMVWRCRDRAMPQVGLSLSSRRRYRPW